MAALDAADTDRAIVLADEALQAGIDHPLLLNLSAFALEREGRLDEALDRLMRALELSPNDVLILTSIGATLSQQGKDRQALIYFDGAATIHPGHAPAHNGRGTCLLVLGELDEGRRAFLRAADLDPRYPDPLGALADLALRKDDGSTARLLAERALALDAGQASAVMVMAKLDAKAGDHAIAAQRLTALLDKTISPLHRAAAQQLLADELEMLDRPVEAFALYTQANQLVREIHSPLYSRPDVEIGIQLAERLQAAMDASTAGDWSPAAGVATPPCKGHVFLVGFVRSGTTLLEQVLASHPDVVALEEQATLRALTPAYFSDDEGLERLKHLDAEEADRLRADYWARVSSFGVDPTDKVFVDKAPLSSLWLPMVAKLFPDAKVLFAVRDPRDVVVSSFRHRFQINALAWAFTDLVATAQFYRAVMDLVDRYRKKLGLTLYQHKHEDIVLDFDGEVGRICDFLGIAQSEGMRDFAETAKRRDVRTPSAEQVRRGLFTEGMGRWRRYGDETAAMLPILRPWVERFGYAPDVASEAS